MSDEEKPRKVDPSRIRKAALPVKYIVRTCEICQQDLDPDRAQHPSWEITYVNVKHELPSECITFLQSELDRVKNDVKYLAKRMDEVENKSAKW